MNLAGFMRDLLRRASKNRVIRKRLPTAFGSGTIYCSPESMLSVWKPGWRSKQVEGLFQWAQRFVQPGMCVWDLGANQGIFSFAASSRAGSDGMVYAFEPDLFLVDLLRRSTASGTHRGAPVRVLPMAVGESNCVAEFLIARTDRALNHLRSAQGNPRTGGAREVLLVPCAPLDWMLDQIRPPDLVKIDIEGAELLALRSARRMLDMNRPVLILESAPENSEAIGELLLESDYLMCDVNDTGFRSRRVPAWNTLAWPAERVDFPRGGINERF